VISPQATTKKLAKEETKEQVTVADVGKVWDRT
jgi:hypothetical protein